MKKTATLLVVAGIAAAAAPALLSGTAHATTTPVECTSGRAGFQILEFDVNAGKIKIAPLPGTCHGQTLTGLMYAATDAPNLFPQVLVDAKTKTVNGTTTFNLHGSGCVQMDLIMGGDYPTRLTGSTFTPAGTLVRGDSSHVYNCAPQPTPTPSETPSPTPTPTPTPTVTPTPSPTPTPTPTPTVSSSATPTPTPTVTSSELPTPTPTESSSPSVTPTPTPTVSSTPVVTVPAVVVPTDTPTPSTPVVVPASPTPSPTPSVTPTKRVVVPSVPKPTTSPSATTSESPRAVTPQRAGSYTRLAHTGGTNTTPVLGGVGAALLFSGLVLLVTAARRRAND